MLNERKERVQARVLQRNEEGRRVDAAARIGKRGAPALSKRKLATSAPSGQSGTATKDKQTAVQRGPEQSIVCTNESHSMPRSTQPQLRTVP